MLQSCYKRKSSGFSWGAALYRRVTTFIPKFSPLYQSIKNWWDSKIKRWCKKSQIFEMTLEMSEKCDEIVETKEMCGELVVRGSYYRHRFYHRLSIRIQHRQFSTVTIIILLLFIMLFFHATYYLLIRLLDSCIYY